MHVKMGDLVLAKDPSKPGEGRQKTLHWKGLGHAGNTSSKHFFVDRGALGAPKPRVEANLPLPIADFDGLNFRAAPGCAGEEVKDSHIC